MYFQFPYLMIKNFQIDYIYVVILSLICITYFKCKGKIEVDKEKRINSIRIKTCLLVLVLVLSYVLILNNSNVGKGEQILNISIDTSPYKTLLFISSRINQLEIIIVIAIIIGSLYGMKFEHGLIEYYSKYIKYAGCIFLVILLNRLITYASNVGFAYIAGERYYFKVGKIHKYYKLFQSNKNTLLSCLYYSINIMLYLFFVSLCSFCDFFRLSEKKSIISHDDSIEKNVFSPITTYDELYEGRRSQAKVLIDMINNNKAYPDGGYSICISGEWGSGKTSFMHAVEDNFSKDKEYKHYFIHINLLQIDTIDDLIKYFFKMLKKCLIERHVYVGVFSEYREFVSAFLTTCTNESFSSAIINNLLYKDTDYRDKKELLNKKLDEVMLKDRIIVIVDDIERCSPEKINGTIFFIKEIASLNRCISIFLTDYNKLEKQTGKNMSYFGKFLNTLMYLPKIDYYEIFLNYNKRLKDLFEDKKGSKISDENIDYLIKNNCHDLYNIIHGIGITFSNELIKLTDEYNINNDPDTQNKLNETNTVQKYFRDKINNPRNSIKIYEDYYNYIEKLSSQIDFASNGDYIKKVELFKIVAIISFIKNCFYSDYLGLKNNGCFQYMISIDKQRNDKSNKKPISNDKKLLLYILNKEVYKEGKYTFDNYMNGYNVMIKERLYNYILNDKNISNITQYYDKYSEELRAEITDKGNVPNDYSFYKNLCILVNGCDSDINKTIKAIEELIDFYTFSCKINNGSYDELFDIFNNDKFKQMKYNPKLTLFGIIYKKLTNLSFKFFLKEDKTYYFSEFITYNFDDIIYNIEKLLRYLSEDYDSSEEKKSKLRKLFEVEIDKGNLNYALNKYLEGMIEHYHLMFKVDDNVSVTDNIKNAIAKKEEYLKEKHIYDFEEVKKMFENAGNANSEIESLLQIYNEGFLSRVYVLTIPPDEYTIDTESKLDYYTKGFILSIDNMNPHDITKTITRNNICAYYDKVLDYIYHVKIEELSDIQKQEIVKLTDNITVVAKPYIYLDDFRSDIREKCTHIIWTEEYAK